MTTVAWIVLSIGAVAIAVVAAWYMTRARKDAVMARCSALQSELARIRTQGGDVSKANELTAQINTCLAEAEAAGFVVDYNAVALTECDAIQTQIDQEWTHYRSTATEDAVKRNNARGQILRLGETLAGCYGALVEQYTTSAELRNLRTKVNYSIAQAISRRNCFNDKFPAEGNTMSGCSRYGVNEPPHTERAQDEHMRVIEPLQAVASKIQARIQRLAKARQAADAARAAASNAARDRSGGAIAGALNTGGA